MFCPKCGTQASNDAQFCQKCGAKLVSDTPAQPTKETATNSTQQLGNTSADVPKKKKSKKLLIIAAIVIALIAILIAANADDMAKRGEQAKKDEEYINSHQQPTENSGSDLAETTEQVLICGISAQDVMDMSAEDIIATFGEPDVHEVDVYYDTDRIEYESDQVCFIMSEYGSVFCLDAPAEKFTLNGQNFKQTLESLISMIGNDYESLGGAGYRWNVDGLSYTFYIPDDEDIADIIEVTKIDTDDPIDNDAYLGDDGSQGNYANLDSALVGRWRSSDGGTLEFTDSGFISSCDFNCWSLVGDTPERVCWEASNGRVYCSAYFDDEDIYTIREIAGPYSESAIEYFILSSSGHKYSRAEGEKSDGIIGKWVSVVNTIWAFQFNADGTGTYNGKYPITWYTYTTDDGDSALSYTTLDSTYFDYSVSGNALTVFLSDSSRVYTKVGN